MIVADVTLTQIGLWLLYIVPIILAFYFVYLVLTKAFRYLGFSQVEAGILVFVSFIFGFPVIIFGLNISNFTIFDYNGWILAISTGGAIIPILLSVYLIIKKRIPLKTVGIGILAVTIVSFIVTSPEPDRGIISRFPYWLLPAIFACIISVVLLKKDFKRGAPLAYSSGIFGVLIGADFLHIPQLLSFAPTRLGTRATIGGAVMLDLIFITGIFAVLLYGLIMYRQRSEAGVK